MEGFAVSPFAFSLENDCGEDRQFNYGEEMSPDVQTVQVSSTPASYTS